MCEPFYRVPNVGGHANGFGLGLHIVCARSCSGPAGAARSRARKARAVPFASCSRCTTPRRRRHRGRLFHRRNGQQAAMIAQSGPYGGGQRSEQGGWWDEAAWAGSRQCQLECAPFPFTVEPLVETTSMRVPRCDGACAGAEQCVSPCCHVHVHQHARSTLHRRHASPRCVGHHHRWLFLPRLQVCKRDRQHRGRSGDGWHDAAPHQLVYTAAFRVKSASNERRKNNARRMPCDQRRPQPHAAHLVYPVSNASCRRRDRSVPQR